MIGQHAVSGWYGACGATLLQAGRLLHAKCAETLLAVPAAQEDEVRVVSLWYMSTRSREGLQQRSSWVNDVDTWQKPGDRMAVHFECE
jgi:hypothetical protein